MGGGAIVRMRFQHLQNQVGGGGSIVLTMPVPSYLQNRVGGGGGGGGPNQQLMKVHSKLQILTRKHMQQMKCKGKYIAYYFFTEIVTKVPFFSF